MPVTHYIWDEENDSLLMETDETGEPTAIYSQMPKRYGGVISQQRGNETRFHLYDALGSTRALTDETGAVTDTYEYDAWGNVIAHTGTSENPFQWIGICGYYADGNNSYYVRARSYYASTGRWTSMDSLMDGDRFNFMMYVSNRPTILRDPSGNRPITFEFNAFIHQKLGNWLHEPLPLSPWDYEGNHRDFGGGESKIRARGTIESRFIGRVAFVSVDYDGTPTVRRTPLDANLWRFQQQRSKIDWYTKTVSMSSVSAGCHTTVTVSAKARYPFARIPLTNVNPSPNIDFEVGFQFKVLGPSYVKVKVEGWHNQFPDYEVLLDGQRPVYGYDSPWGGPGYFDLNAQWPFTADPRYVYADTNCICPRPALFVSSLKSGTEPASSVHEWTGNHPDVS